VTVPSLADVAYAPPEPPQSAGHLLDLYVPDSDSAASWPLVIWSSGSGFRRDDGKHGAANIADFFTRAGYAVAGVSVRSSAQARFPAQVHDVKAAIRWLRANAAELRLDPGRLAIMGNSSGGWLASMAALTQDVDELEGQVGVLDVSSSVQVAVDLYGPTDFLQMDAHMLDGGTAFRKYLDLERNHADPQSPESLLLGAPIETVPELVERANPATYVRPGHPPLLIVHGRLDLYVPHHQSELLYSALEQRGGEATFVSVPGIGHEHPYVTDPCFAEGYVVRSTRTSLGEDMPPPTWETIERFIANALSRSTG
jgi:acetyl esterase/lipase